MDQFGEETQAAADSGDTGTVYKIMKTLTGSFGSKPTIVKDKEGKTLTMEEDQLQRQAEHFQEILNRDDPEEEIDIDMEGPHQEIEMKKGRITGAEIVTAIKQTKGNRASGEDKITADMLKADPTFSA